MTSAVSVTPPAGTAAARAAGDAFGQPADGFAALLAMLLGTPLAAPAAPEPVAGSEAGAGDAPDRGGMPATGLPGEAASGPDARGADAAAIAIDATLVGVEEEPSRTAATPRASAGRGQPISAPGATAAATAPDAAPMDGGPLPGASDRADAAAPAARSGSPAEAAASHRAASARDAHPADPALASEPPGRAGVRAGSARPGDGLENDAIAARTFEAAGASRAVPAPGATRSAPAAEPSIVPADRAPERGGAPLAPAPEAAGAFADAASARADGPDRARDAAPASVHGAMPQPASERGAEAAPLASGGAPSTPVGDAPAVRGSGEPAAPGPATPPAAIAEHIEWLAERGGGAARVRLDPPALGELELEVRLRGRTVEVVLHASGEAARSALLAERGAVAQALAGRELRLDAFHVSAPAPEAASLGADAPGADAGLARDAREQAADQERAPAHPPVPSRSAPRAPLGAAATAAAGAVSPSFGRAPVRLDLHV
jgi:hypothetical protein